MFDSGVKIPFAIQVSTGAIVSVDEVDRGLRCGCRCPSCNALLVARKGEKRTHYFAHHDDSGKDCKLAFETSVRLMLLSRPDTLTSISTPSHVHACPARQGSASTSPVDDSILSTCSAERTDSVPPAWSLSRCVTINIST